MQKGALDIYFVWSTFSAWIIPYADRTKDYVARRREEDSDPTYWMEFEWLAKEIKQIDDKKRKMYGYPTSPNKNINEFLDSESRLI